MSIMIGNQSFAGAALTNVDRTSKTDQLESKLKGSVDKSTDKELMDICKSFEAYFIEQVFKEMRKTVPKSEESNEYLNMFEDKLYEEYSSNITQNGNLGLAKMLYESMKRN